MIIRRALITDLFELSRLWACMVRESRPDLSPDRDMWRNYVAELMRYNGYFMFVAEDSEQLIGFIDYAMQPEPGHGIWVAVINFFYTVPDCRDSDISGKLWKTAIESAKENKAKEFSSICFPDKFDFWKRHGFEQQTIGIRRVI